ncbi:ArsR/SmtB family transcription factor [Dokdonella sp.]|uniref:ArsR/SmtB family transcription factor n=1 Tax=Dokdonella sp. TaxID=2291710 RepID=UPI003C31087D
MDIQAATAILAALAQSTRLEAFRLLVKHEPAGLPAGEVARLLEVPQNTSSTHLAILVNAGLADSQRDGRSIIYRANLDQFRLLTVFLLKDCCSGRTEVCAPLMAELASCCAAPPAASA